MLTSPFSPFGPISPCFPFGPLLPSGPCNPLIPGGPSTPKNGLLSLSTILSALIVPSTVKSLEITTFPEIFVFFRLVIPKISVFFLT